MPLTSERLLTGPVYVIAEIGVNHGGQLAVARDMVLAARDAGADAVKFQTFTASALATQGTPKTEYQERRTAPAESHFEMLRALELSRPDHRALADFCRAQGIDFLSTPYDVDSARFLHDLGVDAFKVASADIVDLPLLEYIASTGKRALVSVGMATLGEIEPVVELFRRDGPPRLVLLHCVSNYPSSDASLNLRVMNTLHAAFDTPVGFSDHSEGAVAAVAAVTLGARVVEKHFTLDRSLAGPDHQASSTPREFAELVTAIRRVERMLGSPVKRRQDEERSMCEVSRKSVVLARSVRAGEMLAPGDVTLLRPGTGLPPRELNHVVGRRARRDLALHHMISLDDVE